MIIVRSKNNIPVRLTIERWKHIILRHPEMDNQRKYLLETITDPDMIQEGDFGELIAIRFYEQTPLTSKYLVAVYKESEKKEGFIITAYYANKPSKRRQKIWKR